MKELQEAILTRGKVINQDVLLVDTFLNHQVDPALMHNIGETFASFFRNGGVQRILTIESSGIAPAAFTAYELGVPLVIMKKQISKILTGDLMQTTVRSFTKGTEYQLTVKRDFLPAGERVLFIDDYLASGEAAFGAINLVREANATLCGIGIVIEKSFQSGRARLDELGIPVLSLARVSHMGADGIEFID
ncbi:MAG: xanthine phosphoribosyltransferase [Clostridia bacterium]|nr:xanthine phosphoribosyltransferase [Clostridia bacterium]